MIGMPRQLGPRALPTDVLRADVASCQKIGPCGIGERALYLNGFYFQRRYYVDLQSVQRVFKRVAMSKGGFTGKGVFGTLSYLVVQYEGGEKQCLFKREEDVDAFLDAMRQRVPQIPRHSVEAEKKLREKQKRLEEKRARLRSAGARALVQQLDEDIAYLEEEPRYYQELSRAAKNKRTYDRSNPAYRWAALFIVLMGLVAFLYGAYALWTKADFGLYFLLFGLAAIFLFSGANVLPTSRTNRRYIETRLARAEEEMAQRIRQRPSFPLPARYAHPDVLRRMQEVLAEERATTLEEALSVVKADLNRINAEVTVEQEEFDAIMAIKPLFLVHEYQ